MDYRRSRISTRSGTVERNKSRFWESYKFIRFKIGDGMMVRVYGLMHGVGTRSGNWLVYVSL